MCIFEISLQCLALQIDINVNKINDRALDLESSSKLADTSLRHDIRSCKHFIHSVLKKKMKFFLLEFLRSFIDTYEKGFQHALTATCYKKKKKTGQSVLFTM